MFYRVVYKILKTTKLLTLTRHAVWADRMEITPPNPLPPEVLAVGIRLFETEVALQEWLKKPAKWANGKTPDELIANGRMDDVVGALNGIGHGNFL